MLKERHKMMAKSKMNSKEQRYLEKSSLLAEHKRSGTWSSSFPPRVSYWHEIGHNYANIHSVSNFINSILITSIICLQVLQSGSSLS